MKQRLRCIVLGCERFSVHPFIENGEDTFCEKHFLGRVAPRDELFEVIAEFVQRKRQTEEA